MCPLKILNKFSNNFFYLFANFSISSLSIDQRSGNFAFDSIFSCNLGLGTFQKKKRGRKLEKSPNSRFFLFRVFSANVNEARILFRHDGRKNWPNFGQKFSVQRKSAMSWVARLRVRILRPPRFVLEISFKMC